MSESDENVAETDTERRARARARARVRERERERERAREKERGARERERDGGSVRVWRVTVNVADDRHREAVDPTEDSKMGECGWRER